MVSQLIICTLKCRIPLTPDSPIHREVNTLVDTGSLTLNYASPNVASWLTSKGAHTARATRDNRRMVCSVHECTLVDTIVTFKLVYFNETTLTNETINIEAWTLPGLPYDIIIGRPTIEKERLLLDYKKFLSGDLFSFTYTNTSQGNEQRYDTTGRSKVSEL